MKGSKVHDRLRSLPTSPALQSIDSDRVLRDVQAWASVETPSNDGVAVNALMTDVEALLERSGASCQRVPGKDGYGDLLLADVAGDEEGPGILIVTHLDTVHPKGTLDVFPVRVDGERLYGPGVFDMKSGVRLAVHAVECLARSKLIPPLPLRLLVSPDEEAFSPTSRSTVEREARRAKYALVMEPAGGRGGVITARKGVANFYLEAEGQAAHAGRDHRRGLSAIREMARQVERLERLTNYDRNLTVNVGTIGGGTATNVVPERCQASAEARFSRNEDGEMVCEQIRSLRSTGEVSLHVRGGINRPAFGPSEASRRLAEHAAAVARALEVPFAEESSGGGSDGNFAAAVGCATLDGLGAVGGGAHTLQEYIHCPSISARSKLLLGLLLTLG